MRGTECESSEFQVTEITEAMSSLGSHVELSERCVEAASE